MRSPNEIHNIADSVIEIVSEDHEVSSQVADRIRSRIIVLLQSNTRNSLTPPELAKELGVSPDKVLYWIHSGELQAANLATRQGGRPRYSIDRKSVESFKRMRANQSPPPIQKRRKKTPAGVIEFF